MLLNIDLGKERVQENYKPINRGQVFIGAQINNLYDEKRIRLNNVENHQPERYQYKSPLSETPLNLFGFTFTPKGEDTYLLSLLKEQAKQIDLISYNNLLQKYGYTCEENFLLLNKNIFPVDSQYIPKYIPNYKFVDFLAFVDEIPLFQQFTSIKMLLLV